MRLCKWHLELYILLGKNFLLKETYKVLVRVIGAILSHKDFAEGLKMICNGETQGAHWGGGNPVISLEGNGIKHCDGSVVPKIVDGEKVLPELPASTEEYLRSKFRTYLSDDKKQDGGLLQRCASHQGNEVVGFTRPGLQAVFHAADGWMRETIPMWQYPVPHVSHFGAF